MLVAPKTSHDNVTVEPGTTPEVCDAEKLVIVGAVRTVTSIGMLETSPRLFVAVSVYDSSALTVTDVLPMAIMEVATVAIDESVIVMLSASATSQDSVTVEPGTTPEVCDAKNCEIEGIGSNEIVAVAVVSPAALVAVRV